MHLTWKFRPLEDTRYVCARFLGGEVGFVHPRVDLPFEFIEGAAQGRWNEDGYREHQAKT
jgi:hypothetical protein